MDTPRSNPYAMENSLKRYGVDRWGREFVGVNEAGHLTFQAPQLPPVDLQALAETLAAQGMRAPYVVRFPTMVAGRVRRLHSAFASALAENEYPGGYCGVLPIKVNQRRAVIEAFGAISGELGFGLEAGSKPELLIAMSQPPQSDAPLLINGFKDREFIRMAFHAAELGHRVVVVIESMREVIRYVDVYRQHQWKAVPQVGVRAKLYTRGSGRWQSSGGETSKFGLTTSEILAVVRALDDGGVLDCLTLLHFHIGSQITRIKQIKTAVREGARLYAALQQGYAPNMQVLDLGGGMGVDYDGSRSSYPSSANYSVEEYANQTVYEVSEVMRETGAQPPQIITESGRALVAHHAVTIADLREVQGDLLPIPERSDDEHRITQQLRETLEWLTAKNYEEYFHDAVDFRDEALQLFSLGNLSIEDRASAEGLFARIRLKTKKIVEQLKRPSEEIVKYLATANRKYLANFSVFQSLPDAWSIDQVFPAAPLSRHGERPTLSTEIVDITCDSDGCLKSFAHPEENLRYLPLHERRGPEEQYYLGFFMTGAYQDSLANSHNLFMRTHEVIVRHAQDESTTGAGMQRIDLDDDVVLEVRGGATNEDALAAMDFDVETTVNALRGRHLEAETTLGLAWNLGLLQSYPYLTRG